MVKCETKQVLVYYTELKNQDNIYYKHNNQFMMCIYIGKLKSIAFLTPFLKLLFILQQQLQAVTACYLFIKLNVYGISIIFSKHLALFMIFKLNRIDYII